MSGLRGTEGVQTDIVRDLRGYSPLAAVLEGVAGYGEEYGEDYGGVESTERVYAGHPKRPRDYPIGVVITPVFDGSEHLGAGVSRTYRVQVTVLATWSWHDEQEWPILTMQKAMTEVAERMDRAASMPNHRPAGADSGTAIETEDGERLALTADWRIEHAQPFNQPN